MKAVLPLRYVAEQGAFALVYTGHAVCALLSVVGTLTYLILLVFVWRKQLDHPELDPCLRYVPIMGSTDKPGARKLDCSSEKGCCWLPSDGGGASLLQSGY